MNKFPKDHPYMIRLDEVLKQYFVCKVSDANGAEHGEEYEEMKEEILNALFKQQKYDFSEQKYKDIHTHR